MSSGEEMEEESMEEMEEQKSGEDDDDGFGDEVKSDDDEYDEPKEEKEDEDDDNYGTDAYDNYEDEEGKNGDDDDDDYDDDMADQDDNDYYDDDAAEFARSTKLARTKAHRPDRAMQHRNKKMLKMAKTKKKQAATSRPSSSTVRGGNSRSRQALVETKIRTKKITMDERKKAIARLTKPPKRVTQAQYIRKSKDYTFKPKLISKFAGNKVEVKDDNEDASKKFEATLSRFEAKTKSARENIESRRGELDYNARNDKKVCDRCGSEQSFDEWRGKKSQCSACEVGRFVVRKPVREKVCFVCGQRQQLPSQTHCTKHPDQRYKARSVTHGIGYKKKSKHNNQATADQILKRVCPMCKRQQTADERRHKKNKCRKCKVDFVRPSTLPQTSDLEVLNQKKVSRKVLGFMDRMQVDVELRDIKQRRAMQVQKSVRETQIAQYSKKRNKVSNPYAATTSFLERVEQDIEMRRSLASRAVQMKAEKEDAVVAEAKKNRWAKKKMARGKLGVSTKRSTGRTATSRAAQRANERRLSGSPRRLAVQSMEDEHFSDDYRDDDFSDGEISM